MQGGQGVKLPAVVVEAIMLFAEQHHARIGELRHQAGGGQHLAALDLPLAGSGAVVGHNSQRRQPGQGGPDAL